MKKRLVSLLAVFMVLAILLTGCAGAQEDAAGVEEPTTVEEPTEEVVEEPLKVALLLPGTLADQGWNAMGYKGIKTVEEKYGVEISFTESVTQSDMEEIFVNYANLGYDLIFGHGSSFADSAIIASERFPEAKFVIINGIVATDNVVSIKTSGHHAGFLTGAFAALMSETGTVGMVGGKEIPPIIDAVKGFEVGAKYVNPDIEVLTTIIGSGTDAAKAKETALAFIDRGADIVAPLADVAGLGVFEACKERGVYAIGGNSDQYELAPENILVSVIKDLPVSYTFAYEKLLEGTLSNEVFNLGVGEEVIYFSSYHDHADKISDEVQDELNLIIADLIDGKIEF